MPIDGIFDYNIRPTQRQRDRLARQKARKKAAWQKIKDDFARKRRAPAQETTKP